MKKVIIGTRGSALALWQAHYIAKRLLEECQLESEIKIVQTKGDKILDTPLSKIGGKGLFTKELEELLLHKEIDLAVHSLKDVPVVLPDGLNLCAITEREDVRDCFLSLHYGSIAELPQGARVGTTSLRRTMQVKSMRQDLQTQSLRGNVQTRLKRLENGEFEGIILASAGLKRLGIQGEIPFCHFLSTQEMLPAMGQGALGLESHQDSPFNAYFAMLNDPQTALLCGCEREFVKRLDGGCQVPIGVYAMMEDEAIVLEAKIGLPSGGQMLRSKIKGQNAKEIATKLADEFLAQGAREILQKAQEWDFSATI
ncbi:hydroxymethylbilane synthase [Helicobacter enhydrae]|uniref:Porphobilinogen deaminase n=1 Tax=Helicobacter enhydrae TaxID=222136 RepID=A0A1B1U407_9HELI|nr:hydroxymethylbilane synthase [Helicobacter enhydrae]ANV97486.1 hydroxymethylbilane synthase [Helicobacter enhydrae]